MKKILNALFLTLLTVFTFSSCSDVPSPYDILGEGDVPGLTGDGTKENPYDIASAQQKQDGSIAWVQGYIVGTIENYTDASGSAKFAAPFTAKNNLLIAASETETNIKNCVVVQLVSGTDLYTKLNLVDNADANLHKILSIQGSLEKFYGFPGVKSTTAATLDGKDVGGSDIPTDEDNPFGLDASNPLNEIKADFEEQPDFVQEGTYNSNLNYNYALDGWKNIAFVGDRKWTGVVFKDNAKYIQASANKGTAATYTSWFISPAFTVNNIKDKTVSFDCAGAYYYSTTTLKVYFLELVDGVMQKTEIPVAGIPTSGDNFVWTKGLEINLDSYSGKIGFIGFEYVAEGGASKSTTYQIDNIKSGKSEQGGEDENVVIVTKDTPYEETFKSSFGKFTIDNKELGGLESVWTIDADYDCALAYAYNGTNAVAAESWMISPIIDLASIQATDDISLTFTQKSQKKGNAEEYMLKVKDVTSNSDWQAIELNQPAASFAATLTDIDLKPYAGKKIQFAIVYKNAVTEGTPNKWEIMNLKVGVKPALPGGTKEDPLTCAEVIALAGSVSSDYYVKGYIVGESTSSTKGNFAAPFTQGTNLIIADSANETDYTKCVSVQLPGGDLRTALSLKENAGNHKKQVLLNGTLGVKYCGLYGIKPAKSYEWIN